MEYTKPSRSALASKLAPKSAQASPRPFSSSAASLPAPARTPLDVMVAAALASPICCAGSRRAPASKSTCTSTIGMPGLSTSHTRAPFDSVQCWMGSSAHAECAYSATPAPNTQLRRASRPKPCFFFNNISSIHFLANFWQVTVINACDRRQHSARRAAWHREPRAGAAAWPH
ncbi:hypothetical protein SDC9_74626 [bioreactor metagenome]|uniref:Uncharacterized protein n=1 Tax=bioreactor metagenome TaxID=1076179 RepID=A0A644YII0_9ZZZZ